MNLNKNKRLAGIGISRRGDRKFVIQNTPTLTEEKKVAIPSSPINRDVIKQMTQL